VTGERRKKAEVEVEVDAGAGGRGASQLCSGPAEAKGRTEPALHPFLLIRRAFRAPGAKWPTRGDYCVEGCGQLELSTLRTIGRDSMGAPTFFENLSRFRGVGKAIPGTRFVGTFALDFALPPARGDFDCLLYGKDVTCRGAICGNSGDSKGSRSYNGLSLFIERTIVSLSEIF
jgi:hypothetical protein